MVFQRKSYQEIVEEVIEHVTKGTAREKYDYDPDQVKHKLENTPVKNVVKVEGMLRGAQHVFLSGNDYRQSGDMLEWVSSGERPDPATPFFVNYTFDEPSGITDANPGSVVRTIVEAVAREISLLYEEMDRVYQSGFIDTASGKALEMVVSLLGIERTPPQNATGLVVFGRSTPPEEINVPNEVYVFDGRRPFELKTQPVSHLMKVKGISQGESIVFQEETDFLLENGSLRWLPEGTVPDENSSIAITYAAYQKIVVPSGVTVATSSRDPRRVRSFVTTEQKTLSPQIDGKWEAEVPVRATAPGKEGNVLAGAVQLMPRPPLGIEYVVNKQDIVTGVDAERDEELRARAKKALEAAGKATYVAVESAVRRIEGVRSILIQDRPDNVAGIVRIVVDGGENEAVQKAIDETRSAGIYVEFRRPKIANVDVNITAIVLQGVSPTQSQAGIEERVRTHISKLEIGEDIVYGRLMATVLQSAEIHDIEDMTLLVRREGEAPSTMTGENLLMSRDERAQVRNVNVSVRVKE